jgi:hypothetical protein
MLTPMSPANGDSLDVGTPPTFQNTGPNKLTPTDFVGGITRGD